MLITPYKTTYKDDDDVFNKIHEMRMEWNKHAIRYVREMQPKAPSNDRETRWEISRDSPLKLGGSRG